MANNNATKTKWLIAVILLIVAPDLQAQNPTPTGSQVGDTVRAFVPGLMPVVEVTPPNPVPAEGQDSVGSVLVLLVVDQDGNVANAEALTGLGHLRQPALDAVKQWKFRPVIRNSQAVATFTTATVLFSDTQKGGGRGSALSVDELDVAQKRLDQLEIEMPRSIRQKLEDLEQDSQGGDSIRRFHALSGLAKAALQADMTDRAESYARELLTIAPQYPQNWNYGNAIQDGNMVLGLVALRREDFAEARKRLLASAESKGSPQMNSFGPNTSLAKALLEKGERESVLRYFSLCTNFWTRGRQTLDTWIKDVQEGRMPNFGPNLSY